MDSTAERCRPAERGQVYRECAQWFVDDVRTWYRLWFSVHKAWRNQKGQIQSPVTALKPGSSTFGGFLDALRMWWVYAPLRSFKPQLPHLPDMNQTCFWIFLHLRKINRSSPAMTAMPPNYLGFDQALWLLNLQFHGTKPADDRRWTSSKASLAGHLRFMKRWSRRILRWWLPCYNLVPMLISETSRWAALHLNTLSEAIQGVQPS